MRLKSSRSPGSAASRLLIPLLVALSGCGDTQIAPDADIAPLVGDWDAVAFEVTSAENPLISVDILEQGAEFFINVQPSGGFTTQLSFQGAACTELGDLETREATLLMKIRVTTCGGGSRTDTATFSVTGDILTLQAGTVFDFDLNGTSEAAHLDAELARR